LQPGKTTDGRVWLDATRLLSRIGRGSLTGIDRVELAYLDHLLARQNPQDRVFCRTTRGCLLLRHAGGQRLADMARGLDEAGPADLISRVTGRGARPRHKAEATLRPFAEKRCPLWRLQSMLKIATGTVTYVNVGHANLSDHVLGVFSRSGARCVVMVHDLIPLTHPDTVVVDLPDKFAGRMDRVRCFATHVICNSSATQRDLAALWATETRVPEIFVAPLGLDPVDRPDLSKATGVFVMLGTIEARKNHATILDAWDILAQRMPADDLPQLHIIGPRGWRAEAVLDRLDRHPLNGTAIFEHGALPDSQMRYHLARASALLFPSLAEGYGYPPLEALQLGTLPIVSDLPVLRENLGKQAVYLPPNDPYSWAETIMQLVHGTTAVPRIAPFDPPSWETHFSELDARLGCGQGKDP